MDPLSKFIVVQYQSDGWWDIFKTQYLDTIEQAKDYVKYCSDVLDDNETTYKIFELKEVK